MNLMTAPIQFVVEVIPIGVSNEHDSLKWFIESDGPNQCEVMCVDDVDALARTIAQVVLPTLRINETDIERRQRGGECNGC